MQAAASAGGSPVIFETGDDFWPWVFRSQTCRCMTDAQYQVVTDEQSSPSVSFAPFSNQPQAERGACIWDSSGAVPPGPNRLTMHAAATGMPAPVQVGPDLTGSSLPPVVGALEYWAGTASGWQQLTIDSDGTNYFTQSGILIFDGPGRRRPRRLSGRRLATANRPDPVLDSLSASSRFWAPAMKPLRCCRTCWSTPSPRPMPSLRPTSSWAPATACRTRRSRWPMFPCCRRSPP